MLFEIQASSEIFIWLYFYIYVFFFLVIITEEKKKKTVNLCESGIKQVVGLKELKNIYFLYWGIGNRTPHLKHVHTYCRNITINYFILFLFLLLLFHTQLPKPSFLSSGPNQIKSLSLCFCFSTCLGLSTLQRCWDSFHSPQFPIITL